MLGLDIGWNCYISLGNDAKASSPKNIHSEQEFLDEDNEKQKLIETSSSTLMTNKQPMNVKKKYVSKYKKKKNVFHQKKRLFAQHKKFTFTQSLPALKYAKSKYNFCTDADGGGPSDNSSLIGLSSQMVKFDLSNLNSKPNKQFKKRKERISERFNSDDEDEEVAAAEDLKDKDSDSSDSELNFNAMNKQRKKKLSHMNSKTSMASSKNYHKLHSLSASSNRYQEDENSSHQTNRSEFSETEFFGNAVCIFLAVI